MSETIEYASEVRFWLNQIEAAQSARKDYYERGKKVIDRYLDEKRLQSQTDSVHRMNVLWSNVETTKPALYAKTPNPKVQRRYRDKDPIGKWGAIVLERSLGYSLDAYDMDYSIRNAVQDLLLPGCGQLWVTYEPTIEGEGQTEKLVWEKCNVEHLNWRDYLSSVSRTTDEDWWRARRVFLTKEQIAKRFKGMEDKVSFTEDHEDRDTTEKSDRVKKAAVWEIWCESDGKRYFVSKSCSEFLEEPGPPPHQFDGFYPCPRPLLATTTPESTIPRPDFYLYQDQANEIDRLTQRINILTDALKVIGVYSAPLEGEDNVFSTLLAGSDNKMVPVKNWAMFAQAGGFDGAVDFFPLKDVIDTLNECYAAREQAKAAMYEITGISDIVRGASDASETATAQQIKSQWGSLRIRDRQAEVQRFVRDVMRLKSEIIAERYQLDTLKAMTNCPLLMQAEKQQLQQRQQMIAQAQAFAEQNPEQAQAIAQANPQLMQQLQPLSLDELQRLREPTWEEVYQLLKDQRTRSYRIEIETDSTINADEVAEKQSRVEFVQAMTSFVQGWGPIILQAPKLAPLAGALMIFGARAFKQVDALETEIEAMVDMMSQQAMLPQPATPPDPKMEAQKQQAEFDAKKREDDGALAAEDRQFQRDKMAFERDRMQRQGQHEQARMAMEMEDAERERASKIEAERLKAVGSIESEKARKPSVEELTTVMAPILEAMAQFIAQITQGNQQMQRDMTQAVSTMADAAAQLAAAASAPKQIVVQRDSRGQITGGTATPRLN